jgi:hypothetical protein
MYIFSQIEMYRAVQIREVGIYKANKYIDNETRKPVFFAVFYFFLIGGKNKKP